MPKYDHINMCGAGVWVGYPGLQMLPEVVPTSDAIHFIKDGVVVGRIINIGHIGDVLSQIEARELREYEQD